MSATCAHVKSTVGLSGAGQWAPGPLWRTWGPETTLMKSVSGCLVRDIRAVWIWTNSSCSSLHKGANTGLYIEISIYRHKRCLITKESQNKHPIKKLSQDCHNLILTKHCDGTGYRSIFKLLKVPLSTDGATLQKWKEHQEAPSKFSSWGVKKIYHKSCPRARDHLWRATERLRMKGNNK